MVTPVPKVAVAAVLAEFEAPLTLRELPVPELEPGALLVRVDAATGCGSDVHLWTGDLGAGRRIELAG